MRRSILAVDRHQQGAGKRSGLSLVITACLALMGTEAAFAVNGDQDLIARNGATARNIDERLAFDQSQRTTARYGEQRDALNTLRQNVSSDLAVTFDGRTGVTRSIYNPTGYLTDAVRGSADSIAEKWIAENFNALGLSSKDLEGYETTDAVFSEVSGASHIYLRQMHDGIPVYNGQLHVNVNRDGRLMSVNNAFVRELGRTVNSVRSSLDASAAVASVFGQLGSRSLPTPKVVDLIGGARQTTVLDHSGISEQPIVAELAWLPIQDGETRLVWNFSIWTLDSLHLYDFTVDAESGKVWTRIDQTSDATFRAYEQPVESPNHTSPQPPSDARALIVDPENATASPDGWFNAGGTIMDGNNVHACADANANNGCDTGQPSCGAGQVCDFPVNFNAAPSNSLPAAITNLFYWNNTIHDVQYQYGFDEAGGNFQESNFGRGGAGSDSVNAEAQDGSGNCNANFSSPPDGSNPRMQMFTCNRATPSRDGDYDNGVIVHEYGHGISIRQVGGPSNSSCLGNRQQAGEGWSDVLALMYTAEIGDVGTDQRGVGSYLFALADDDTIRPQPYSTSTAINNFTYQSINGAVVPHGVGSVWAQAAWEVYWALVDEHGFEADLLNFDINDANEAGNKRAMFYINEGLKNTACSPTFVDNRDGIIQAAMDNFGGEDVCMIWQAFADFGLGVDAVSGGSNSTTPTNGFNIPASCSNEPPPPPPPPPGDCPAGSIDFNAFTTESYSNQDAAANVAVADAGQTLVLTGNTWRRSTQSFTVTPNTVVAFDFASNIEGEIHAIAFDEDQDLNNDPRHFQFHGTQNWTGNGRVGINPPAYTGNGAFQSYEVAIGESYTGNNMRLVFTNDNDAGSTNDSRFRCVRVFEADAPPPPPPGSCTVEQNFDNDATGWTTGGNCSTGTFVLGTPSEQTNGGVTTQVGGDNTSGSGQALFTATNTSAGANDVDGGTCTLMSPVFNVANASDLDLAYFHGQRDAGDDASDGMLVEVSTNGGASFSNLVNIGDVTSNAVWTDASMSIAAGSQVQIRVQVTDGAGPGDLVEGGIDDVSICDTP